MKQTCFLIALVLCAFQGMYAQQNEELTAEEIEAFERVQLDSIRGREGAVALASAHCTLNVPAGYVFLDPDESRHLLVDYWGNPEKSVDEILGTLVSAENDIYFNVTTAYVVSYDDAGYVSDKDAASIDYDELLKDMQASMEEENESSDTDKWELVGWAWHPTYDAQKKVLGWAKLLRINDRDVINYDVRVLGKAGFVIITAVADPEDKDELMAANSDIIGSVVYDNGYAYADFNPDKDHVAEWTIGGLVAGKVLAKAGVWAFLAKFSKLIIIAVVGFFALVRKKIARLFGFGKRQDETLQAE